jgi:hypothetical protein
MQARPERVESNPALAGEVCGVTGAAQQQLHLARQSSFSISTRALSSREPTTYYPGTTV